MNISYTNNTNSTEEILPLELSEVIKKEGIVDTFVFDKRSNCIVARITPQV